MNNKAKALKEDEKIIGDLGLSAKEKAMIEEIEAKERAKTEKKELTKAELKRLVLQGLNEGKNPNQIAKANPKVDRNKIYRMKETLEKEGVYGKKKVKPSGKATKAESTQIKPDKFTPKIDLKNLDVTKLDLNGSFENLQAQVAKQMGVDPSLLGLEGQTPILSPTGEQYDFVSTQQAKYLSYILPSQIAKMWDQRLELPKEFEKDGAELHAQFLNAHPSKFTNAVSYLGLIGYWVRVITFIIFTKIKLMKEDKKKEKKTVEQTEDEIKADIAATGGTSGDIEVGM